MRIRMFVFVVMMFVAAGAVANDLHHYWHQVCGGWHETAAGLARESLVIRDGTLYGKGADRPVAEFLKRHGRVQAAEIPFFVDLLTRVEREVHGGR